LVEIRQKTGLGVPAATAARSLSIYAVQKGGVSMRMQTIAVLSVAALLTLAAQAAAFGGASGSAGGGGSLTGHVTVTSTGKGGFTFTGSGTGAGGSGSVSGSGSGTDTGSSGTFTVSAAEPLGVFAVGLGLIGARFLRRRQ
jgi:hypothetical protein